MHLTARIGLVAQTEIKPLLHNGWLNFSFGATAPIPAFETKQKDLVFFH